MPTEQELLQAFDDSEPTRPIPASVMRGVVEYAEEMYARSVKRTSSMKLRAAKEKA